MNDIRRTILWVILVSRWCCCGTNGRSTTATSRPSCPSAKTAARRFVGGAGCAAAPAACPAAGRSRRPARSPVQGSAPAIGEKVTVSTDVFKGDHRR